MVKIAIIDYGAGNLFSLKHRLEKMGVEAEIVEGFSERMGFNGLILPGVGNWGAAVRVIEGYRADILDAVRGGLPFLGICLGAQLIFERSEEDSGLGLGILEGDVVKLPSTVKIPHIGWNTVKIVKWSEIFRGVRDGEWFYFVHSYYPRPKGEVAAAESEYGVRFPAVVADRNVFGTQFHPEKSGPAGLKLLDNFISICKR